MRDLTQSLGRRILEKEWRAYEVRSTALSLSLSLSLSLFLTLSLYLSACLYASQDPRRTEASIFGGDFVSAEMAHS